MLLLITLKIRQTALSPWTSTHESSCVENLLVFLTDRDNVLFSSLSHRLVEKLKMKNKIIHTKYPRKSWTIISVLLLFQEALLFYDFGKEQILFSLFLLRHWPPHPGTLLLLPWDTSCQVTILPQLCSSWTAYLVVYKEGRQRENSLCENSVNPLSLGFPDWRRYSSVSHIPQKGQQYSEQCSQRGT